jgi:hypothetical protein
MALRKKINPNKEMHLEILRKIWLKFPDLRLCQIIGNCFDCKDGDCYYVEDEELMERLIKVYKLKR